MQRLLIAYAAAQSRAAAIRLVTYARRHPMALCLLSDTETALLAAAECMVQS